MMDLKPTFFGTHRTVLLLTRADLLFISILVACMTIVTLSDMKIWTTYCLVASEGFAGQPITHLCMIMLYACLVQLMLVLLRDVLEAILRADNPRFNKEITLQTFWLGVHFMINYSSDTGKTNVEKENRTC
jgi:hypothetical protein